MGDTLGVHKDEELQGLSQPQRDQVKQEALRLLRDSQQIRAVIEKEPRLLTRNTDINTILKQELAPLIAQLRNR